MKPTELARLQEQYRRLPDAKLAELHEAGPTAFASKEIWTLLDEEFSRRPVFSDRLVHAPSEPSRPVAKKILGLPVFIFVLFVSPFLLIFIYLLYIFLVFSLAGS
jgi:pilus assembly protein TadC